MQRILSRLIRLAAYLGFPDDSGDVRIVNLSDRGKTYKGVMWLPYGMSVHPPDDSGAVVFLLRGNESDPIALVDKPQTRYKVDKGEVKLGPPEIGSFVFFDKDGNVTVSAPGKTVNVTGTTINLNAATIVNCNSDLDMQDNDILNVAGTASLDTHTHGGVESGGSNTGGMN